MPLVPVLNQIVVGGLWHRPQTSWTGKAGLREGFPLPIFTMSSLNQVGGHQVRLAVGFLNWAGTETAMRQVVVAPLPSVMAALRYW